MNRNIKSNRIHASLKKIVLHFTRIKSKLETGLGENRSLFFSEEKAEKIKNKIETQRKRLNTRNYISSKNSTILKDSNLDNSTTKNSNLILNINRRQKPKIDVTNINENIINKSKKNTNLKLSSFRSTNNRNINLRKDKNYSSMDLYSKIINSEDQRKKKENNFKYEIINIQKKKQKNSLEKNMEQTSGKDIKFFKSYTNF